MRIEIMTAVLAALLLAGQALQAQQPIEEPAAQAEPQALEQADLVEALRSALRASRASEQALSMANQIIAAQNRLKDLDRSSQDAQRAYIEKLKEFQAKYKANGFMLDDSMSWVRIPPQQP